MKYLQMPWGAMAFSDNGGVGPPLVLLHGTFCDAADWEGVVAALPAQTRVVNVEFRGHGLSDTPPAPFSGHDLAADVSALLAHLQLDNAILVGHSLGGMVAMLVAQRSNAVAGLVLLEGWTSQRAYARFSGDRTYGLLDAAAIRRIEQKIARYRDCCPDIWQAFSDNMRDFDAYGFLSGASIPIYEVYGTRGQQDDTEAALEIPRNPAIRMIWISGAGHYLPHENPAQVTEVCRQALADLAGRVA